MFSLLVGMGTASGPSGTRSLLTVDIIWAQAGVSITGSSQTTYRSSDSGRPFRSKTLGGATFNQTRTNLEKTPHEQAGIHLILRLHSEYVLCL